MRLPEEKALSSTSPTATLSACLVGTAHLDRKTEGKSKGVREHIETSAAELFVVFSHFVV